MTSNQNSSASPPTVILSNNFSARWYRYWGAVEDYNWFDYILDSYKTWHRTFRLWDLPEDELGAMELRLGKCREILGLEGIAADRVRMIGHGRSMRSKFFSRRTFYNLAGLSLLYGGAHVAAWNTHSPTVHEHLLWKISSSLASLFVPMSLLVYRGYRNLERYTAIKNHKIHQGWMNVATSLLYFYFNLGAPVFIAARVYLTVESFISLRSLPEGSFQMVKWGSYWPHC
jgi:hypothetical protein